MRWRRWKRWMIAAAVLATAAILFAAHDPGVAIVLCVITGLWALADFLYMRSLRRRPEDEPRDEDEPPQ